MSGLGFAARMAVRELKAAPRRMALLMGTVAIGVAALVAISSFTDNLRSSVHQQARALLGADLSFSTRQAPSPRVEALFDTLSGRAELARVTSFAGMAYVPRTSGARLVQVAAVEGQYPFYGEIGTQPREAWRRLQTGRHVIVDPTLLSALNARLGDTLVLGDARFAIIGTIQSAPSEVGFRFAIGPRIYIPAQHLGATGLLGFGARVQYEIFSRLPPDASAQQLADRYRKALAGGTGAGSYRGRGSAQPERGALRAGRLPGAARAHGPVAERRGHRQCRRCLCPTAHGIDRRAALPRCYCRADVRHLSGGSSRHEPGGEHGRCTDRVMLQRVLPGFAPGSHSG